MPATKESKEKHPLKRKSIKPSSSTVRGMLPMARFRPLDAAMQSLRSAGLRLEWRWKDVEIGWVCAGLLDDVQVCELRPTSQPLLGVLEMSPAQRDAAIGIRSIPAHYKKVLKFPVTETKKAVAFEFELEITEERDLFSNLVEALLPVFDSTIAPPHSH